MNFYRHLIFAVMVIADCKGADFFLSFSVTNINFKNVNYQINISRALTEENKKKKFLFKIECDNINPQNIRKEKEKRGKKKGKEKECKIWYNKTIEICLKTQSEKIFNELLKRDIILTSLSKKTSNSFYEKTKIVYLPKRFDIIIKNNEAYFYIKEDN